MPQARGWSQDNFLRTGAPVQGRGDFSKDFTPRGPGTSKDLVPVLNTQALVFCSTEPRGDNWSKDEFPPLPGALGDMVPPLRNPALVHDDTTQRGHGSWNDEPFPSPGLAATPITVLPDGASGKLGPEQTEDDFSKDIFFPLPGKSEDVVPDFRTLPK